MLQTQHAHHCVTQKAFLLRWLLGSRPCVLNSRSLEVTWHVDVGDVGWDSPSAAATSFTSFTSCWLQDAERIWTNLRSLGRPAHLISDALSILLSTRVTGGRSSSSEISRFIRLGCDKYFGSLNNLKSIHSMSMTQYDLVFDPLFNLFSSPMLVSLCVTMCHLCPSPVLQWQRIGAWDWSRPPYPPCKFQQLGIVGIQKTRDYRDSKNVKEQGHTSGKNRHRNVATLQGAKLFTRPQGRHSISIARSGNSRRPSSSTWDSNLCTCTSHCFTLLHSASYDCFWKQQDSVNLFNILFFGHKFRVERLQLLSTTRARLCGRPLARLHQRVHAEAKSRLCPVTRLALKIFDAHLTLISLLLKHIYKIL